MSAPSMIRVLRSRETYGFVKGRLDATLEAIDWVRSAIAASALAFLAMASARVAGVDTWRPAFVAFVALVGSTVANALLSRRADLLHASLEEAWSECEDALAAFNREPTNSAALRRTETP